MKRGFVGAVFVGAALVGCAGILGLDELPPLVDEADASSEDAAFDTGTATVDAGVEASPDAFVPCPGRILWNDHCYLPVGLDAAISWSVANDQAKDLGGELAVPDAPGENEFLYALASDAGLPAPCPNAGGDLCGPWLGGRQDNGAVEPAGGWRWLTGELVPFDAGLWRSTEPNNGNVVQPIEQVMGFYREPGGTRGVWGDYQDNAVYNLRGFIVESAP